MIPMIRWSLDPVPHGPLVRTRIFADDGDGAKPTAVGSAFLTQEQYADLRNRLADDDMLSTRVVPCALCGKPVPAGRATHADCEPLVCMFCTQCGKPLDLNERALSLRVCLSCAPVPLTGALALVYELEPGESEGPDIAATISEQPPADPLGPAPFVPEQRQGGAGESL